MTLQQHLEDLPAARRQALTPLATENFRVVQRLGAATAVVMIGSGLRIAMRAKPAFEKLLATGLTALLGIQAFIIIGGVTRVLPLTGVTLPFVSYGGSSLLANYVLLALLLRVSDETETNPSAPTTDARAEVAA